MKIVLNAGANAGPAAERAKQSFRRPVEARSLRGVGKTTRDRDVGTGRDQRD